MKKLRSPKKGSEIGQKTLKLLKLWKSLKVFPNHFPLRRAILIFFEMDDFSKVVS